MIKRCLIFIIFIVIVSNVNSIGLAVNSKTNINFIPNSEYVFIYYIISDNGVEAEPFLNGDLEKYAKISEIQDKAFSVKLKLPSELESGMHGLGVGVKEISTNTNGGAGVGALTSVISPIKLFVPYKGKYIEAEFDIPNGNNNETITAKIKLKNLGEQNLSSVYSDIEIYDFNNIKIATAETNKISLNKFQEDEIHAELDLNDYSYGEYNTKAIIYYDGETKTLGKNFRVGTYLVNIINYTKNFYQNEFNEFKINVGSEWNGLIDNVYAIIDINGETLKTTGASLNSFQVGELMTYWNPGNISLGKYPTNITLFYAGKENKQTGEIFIVEKNLLLINKLKPLIIPSLVVFLILLMIFNMFLILKLKNKKEK